MANFPWISHGFPGEVLEQRIRGAPREGPPNNWRCLDFFSQILDDGELKDMSFMGTTCDNDGIMMG